MKNEYVIWGISPNKNFEEILYTKAKNLEQAETVVYMLETRYQCKKCRIQILNFNIDYNQDFSNSINIFL
jgi:hypothetical protein